MSYYITIHNGPGVDESVLNKWVNISFSKQELFYLRTDGALICYILERIRERKCTVTLVPKDRQCRWCISIPASRAHTSNKAARADALQLAEWYRVQILNGNASINRELLFDRNPYHEGKECCRENVCDRMLHPEWWPKNLYKDPDEDTEDTGEGTSKDTSKDS
ncbi:hypothetical protein N7516_003839 [Penicillium verrucosum]|uniref:uncharacterized protein n=1 Tax=Penicillium verrucosum TaxID=60171 RepID=UPI002544E06B|nr:uncharacterized protein N7516_003839 [Penicillium verrucosum]KAJ5943671.1 hypothetical protein N7516_003839 [Penicillium verrucosum]